MARRLAPTTQRAFSAAISVGFKPLSKLWAANDSTSRLSRRGLSEEEQLFASRSNLRGRTYYTEGGRGGSSSSQGGRPNSTAAQAYEQYGQQQQQQERGDVSRPPMIQWDKDLANTVQLIGRVGKDVVVKYLDSGKVVANTCLAVRKSANRTDEPSWFELEIWDGLAEIAAHHVEKGEQIFVAGRIIVDKNVKGDTTYNSVKVVVKDLLFVEPYNDQRQPHGQEEVTNMGSSQRNWHQQPANQPSQGMVVQKGSSNNYNEAALATEKRWQEFFSDPTQWWDNREKKRNPKSPDFKHKSTDEALWVNSWSNPPWVAQQLAVLEEKKVQHSGDFGGSHRGSHATRLSSFKDSDLQY